MFKSILAVFILAVAAVAAADNYPPSTDTYRFSTMFIVLQTDSGIVINRTIKPRQPYYGQIFDSVMMDDVEADCEAQLNEPCTVTFFGPILTPR